MYIKESFVHISNTGYLSEKSPIVVSEGEIKT